MQTFEWNQTQILSLIGASVVLFAFVGGSFNWMNREKLPYAFCNFLGTGLLALSVLNPLNLGLLIVEVIWSITSLWLCVQALRKSS